MTFSKIGSKPQRRKHIFSCSSAFFRFLPSAVEFLRPVEDRRKIPFPEIRLRFQNREGHAKTARGNGKMKILYYTPPPCVRERVSRISRTEINSFSAAIPSFGAGENCSTNQMFYWTPPTSSFTYSTISPTLQSSRAQMVSIVFQDTNSWCRSCWR